MVDGQVCAPPRRVRPVSHGVPRLPHAPGLDGVRALAVIAVIGYHLDLAWAGGGFLGVEVFFTLSGFLITQLLVAEVGHRGRVDIKGFARARARRLVPALIACVVATVLAYRILLPDDASGLRDDALSSLFYVQNWHLILAGTPYSQAFERPSPLLHLWSLAVEGQLYVLWPLLFVAVLSTLRRPATVWITMLLAGVSSVLMALQFTPDSTGLAYYATDSRASGFLVGAALALMWRPETWSRPLPAVARHGLDLAGGLALVGLFAAFVDVSEFDEALYERGGFLRVGVLTAVVIAAATRRGSLLETVVARPVLQWIGLRAYGIYLYHWPIFVLTRPETDVPGPTWLVDLLRVVATLVVAEVSYRWLETPIRRGGIRTMTTNLRATPAAVAALGVLTVAVLVTGVVAATSVVPSRLAASSTAASVVGDPPAEPAAPAGPPVAAAAPEPPAVPAAPPTPEAVAPAPPSPAGGPPLVLGDSIVLGSADSLRGALGADLTLDGLVGRQFSKAPAIVRAWAATHDGPIVIDLGANGTVEPKDVEAVIAAAGTRRVVLVGVNVPRRWQDGNNAVLRAAAAQHAPQVVFVDWSAIVAANPGILGPDKVHPGPQGRALLAAAVAEAVAR